jgi:hypothetical protein
MFDKRSKNQSRNKARKSSVKMIVLVGLLFLAGAIWGVVSRHAWIFIFSGVAAFYLLSYLKK